MYSDPFYFIANVSSRCEETSIFHPFKVQCLALSPTAQFIPTGVLDIAIALPPVPNDVSDSLVFSEQVFLSLS